jgi:hypothetical protein
MLDEISSPGAPAWQFRRMHAGEMNIDPIESEFFSTEALESLADALVREAVQNSLDARAPAAQARAAGRSAPERGRGIRPGRATQRLLLLLAQHRALAQGRHRPRPLGPGQDGFPGDLAAERLLRAHHAPLREPFGRGARVAIEVPVWVKPAAGEASLAAFDVYLERDETLAGGEEHFVRDGITVAGVRSPVQAGIRAIVSVRDRALSALLGDSENPAHTEWQERSPRFKKRYRHGPFTLRCVKGAPREVVRILARPAAGRDLTLLRHLFSLDVPTEAALRERDARRSPRLAIRSVRLVIS